MLKEKIKVEFDKCNEEELFLLGETLKSIRKEVGISQQELADRMSRERTSISKFELGVSMPTVQVLNDMARALGYKLNITFEKEIKEEMPLKDMFKMRYMDDKREMLVLLAENLKSYSRSIYNKYYKRQEKYYYKNVLNYFHHIEETNMEYEKEKCPFEFDDGRENVKLYVDNPNGCPGFVYGQNWNDLDNLRVYPNIDGDNKSYIIELAHEDETDTGRVYNRELLYKWEVKTYMDVIVAAENIRRAFGKVKDFTRIDIKEFDSLDITDTSALKIEFEQIEEPAEIYERMSYIEIIDEIERRNKSLKHEMYYRFSMGADTEGCSSSFRIEYKRKKWCVYKAFNKYEVTLSEENDDKTVIKLSLDTVKEIVDGVLKYS